MEDNSPTFHTPTTFKIAGALYAYLFLNSQLMDELKAAIKQTNPKKNNPIIFEKKTLLKNQNSREYSEVLPLSND